MVKSKKNEVLLDNLQGLLKEFSNLASEPFYKSLDAIIYCIKSGEGISKGATKFTWGKATAKNIATKHLNERFIELVNIYHVYCIDSKDLMYSAVGKVQLPSEVLIHNSKVEEWILIVSEITRYFRNTSNNKAYHDLELMRLVILVLNSHLFKKEVKSCPACYRVIRNRVYCWEHSSKLPSFHRSIKLKEILRNEQQSVRFLKDREIRNILGEYPSGNKLQFIQIIMCETWDVASAAIAQLVNEYLPSLQKLFSEKLELECIAIKGNDLTKNFDNLVDFIEWTYSSRILDNRFESSRSVFWFVNTLFVADGYFKAETQLADNVDKRFKDTNSRDEEIIRLKRSGFSIRKIEKQVDVNRAQIHNILNKWNITG